MGMSIQSHKGPNQLWYLGIKEAENILQQSQLCTVYYALVERQLHYGDVVWGSLSKKKLAALHRLQTRAI